MSTSSERRSTLDSPTPRLGPSPVRLAQERAARLAETRPSIGGDELDSGQRAALDRAHEHRALACVAQLVVRELARGRHELFERRAQEAHFATDTTHLLAQLRGRGLVEDADRAVELVAEPCVDQKGAHFSIFTQVPLPGSDSISKRSTKRRLPERPRPIVCVVL
jgi:hypothetical protein